MGDDSAAASPRFCPSLRTYPLLMLNPSYNVTKVAAWPSAG